MNITLSDNTVLVDVNTPSISGGAPFNENAKRIEWDKIAVTKSFNQIKATQLKVTFPYQVFTNIIRLWDNQYNSISNSIESKKTVSKLFELASTCDVYNYSDKEKEDIKEIANKLKTNYDSVERSTIDITFADVKLYSCPYYLLIYPTSMTTFDVELVPNEKFKNADQDKLHECFYIAIKLELDDLVNDVDDSKNDIPMVVYSVNNNAMPIAIEKTEVKKNALLYINLFVFVNQGISDLPIKQTYDDYYSVGNFLLRDPLEDKKKQKKKEVYVSKSATYNGLIEITEVFSKKAVPFDYSYTGDIKKTYVYSELLFPMYFKLATGESVNYYLCADSEKRSWVGVFSEGYLGMELDKDKVLYDDFGSFFVFDHMVKPANEVLRQKNIPVIKFDE